VAMVMCLAQPEAVSQAKLGHDDGFMVALAWPGVLKSQSQAVKLWLFGRRLFQYGNQIFWVM